MTKKRHEFTLGIDLGDRHCHLAVVRGIGGEEDLRIGELGVEGEFEVVDGSVGFEGGPLSVGPRPGLKA